MLALFIKYYNTWFVSIEDEFTWVNNTSEKSNLKVLVRLITCTSGEFLDVRLEKDGDWGPQHVFFTMNYGDIVKVENEMVEMKTIKLS